MPRNICGSAIKRHRLALGLSQNALAIKCQRFGWDIDRKLVSKIETGLREVCDYELRLLSRLLGIRPADFFDSSSKELHEALSIATEGRK